jgi:hypothetical protein
MKLDFAVALDQLNDSLGGAACLLVGYLITLRKPFGILDKFKSGIPVIGNEIIVYTC